MARGRMDWSLCLALVALGLSACGRNDVGNMRLSVDSTSLIFLEERGKAPQARQLTAWISPLTQSVYIGVAFTGNGLESVAYDISGNTLSILVTPKKPETAGSGTWTDQVLIAACLDEECKEHIPGSPTLVSVAYTVHSRLAASPTELVFTHTLGSNAPPSGMALSVQNPLSSHWTALASSSWIRLSSTHGATPGSLGVEVDPIDLPLGASRGSVTLTAPETGETVDVPVTLQVKPASLSTTPSSLALGGQDGLELSAPLALSLDTGGNAYDWTAEVDTGGGPPWLKLSSTSGKAFSSATPLTVSVAPTGLTDGVYSGNLHFTSSVAGQTVTRDVPVSLLLAPHKLWVSDNGVALVSTPSVSSLTHTVKVKDNWGLSTTPWTASSDQPWLSVTPSGTGGGSLTLTATPASLAMDSIHYATVTLRYDDGLVRGSDTVRVGLWVGSRSPPSEDFVGYSTYADSVVTDPIRPYAYVQHHESLSPEVVSVYNIYTKSLVTRLTGLGDDLGPMVASSDGSTLYILLTSSKQLLSVDLDTLTVGTSSSVGEGSLGGTYYGLTYVRPNGHGLLLINGGKIYDPTAGAVLAGVTSGFDTVGGASQDGSLVCGTGFGYSTRPLDCYGLRYSDINDGLVTLTARGAGRFGSFGGDVAINQDGSRVYSAGGLGTVTVYDGQTAEPLPSLAANYPCCQVVEVGPDDRLYAADDTLGYGYDSKDVWVYDNAGTLLDAYRASTGSFFFDRQNFRVSGDGRRLVVLKQGLQLFNTP